MIYEKSNEYRRYIRDNIQNKTNAELAADLGLSIDAVKYHIRQSGLTGVRKRGVIPNTEYDDYVKAHYQTESIGIIAESLGVTALRVKKIAERLQLKRSSQDKFKRKTPPIKENLCGQRFGHLVVQKQIGTNKHGQMRYECLCDCGNTTYSTAGNLKYRQKVSCGCQHYNRNQNK